MNVSPKNIMKHNDFVLMYMYVTQVYIKWDNIPEAPNIQLVGVSKNFINKGQTVAVCVFTCTMQ